MQINRFVHAGLLGLWLILFPAVSSGQRIYGTNTAYAEGDWISYTESRYVHSLQVAPELVYVATEGGILRYDFYQKKWLFPFTTSNGLAENNVLAVAYDVGTRLLWCSTPSALCVYDPGAKLWQNFFLDELGFDPNDPVYSIGFNDAGTWFETKNGNFYHTPLQEFRFERVNQNLVDTSVVWFGRRGFQRVPLETYFLPNSLLFIDDAKSYAIQDGEMRNFPLSYYTIDPWQTLWAGTAGMGLFTADTRLQYMIPLPFGLLNPDVRAIGRYEGDFWLGGIRKTDRRRGVTRWNPARNRWNYYEAAFIPRFWSDEVNAISGYRGAIWFGTNYGLVRYDLGQDRWFSYTRFNGLQANEIFALEQGDRSLWVGTKEGLDRIWITGGKKDSLRVQHITPPAEKVAVYDVLWDGGRVWAATNYGLYVYESRTGKGGYYRGVNGPRAEVVMALDRSGDSLWVATLHTVEPYDLRREIWPGGSARRVFPDAILLDIAANGSAVFVGTDQGLFKFNPAGGYWLRYTRRDGLLNNRVQKLLLQGDYLWIGSPEGLTRFYWNSPYRID